MRAIVYPHAAEIGGSQLNAVDIAGAVRDRGHDVLVVSEPGPLVERVRGLGLDHVEVPLDRRRPSLQVARLLTTLVRERGIDVVHGYEWPPVIEAFLGPVRERAAVAVGTVMSMSVVPFFPRTVPLLVSSEKLVAAARAAGHRHVGLLEPPVDTDTDHPGHDGSGFRAEYGIAPDTLLVAMVCRLVPDLKLEGLLAACDAVGELAREGRRIQLVIVGDGRSRAEVEERAARANATAGSRVVVLTGELADPRPAYAAADVTIGMGGSALRSMAFGTPLVVVGERGFSETLTPGSAPLFLRQGWYGTGPGSAGAGASALVAALRMLDDAPRLRAELGAFARTLAVDRFGLRRAAELQEQQYLGAIERGPRDGAVHADAARCVAGLLDSKIRRRVRRWRGGVATDDANAQPLVGRESAQPLVGLDSTQPLVGLDSAQPQVGLDSTQPQVGRQEKETSSP